MKFFHRYEPILPNIQTLEGKTISSDHQNNIVVKSTNGDIILDCQIKTYDGWVARVTREHNQLQPPTQKISMTYMLN